MSENSQGNGSGSLVDVQSLSRQLAQVLSNPEDEAAQELITLMRRVVTPPSTIDVDANGVVHEQARYSDMPKQAPQQVYSNPAFESSIYVHGRPAMESNTFRPTVRPTSFYQNIPSAYEVGNSSGYGQNSYLNNGQTIQHGFTRTHVINNDQHIAQNVSNNGPYAHYVTQALPSNGNGNGSYVQPSVGNNNNNQNFPFTQPCVTRNAPNVYRAMEPLNDNRVQDPMVINRAQITEIIQDMYGPGLRRASKFEAILQEEEQLKNSSLGTYYQDVEGDMEIDVAQVIGKTPIICDTLVKTEKPMNMPSSQPNRRGGQANYRQYSFDLTQTDQIFDELLKQKFIVLSPGHILPSDKEKKGKEYCKWHNSFRHNTNNCVTFRNCVQDLIQKGLLQYAKGDKDPMSIESDPFPKVEINMVNANLAKRLGSTVERQKQGEGDRMETDEESAKSQPLRFPNDYLCIRCGREVKYGEAIIAEKEQKCAFSKSGFRFNTMGGNDLQIYVGAKLIYEGIDPGLFNRIESEHCYGPDDGPFIFRGHPVVPARPGVPSSQDLEAVGYQFPSRGIL
ncbi:hypothetical protein RHSIM_Rhsim12G0055600 [Rhododendron simsii]|uniref:Uncharacterized protein n=1 Tax=Rhododendron simsii TaxID=118357 RepID=A0A834L6N1_RHOSS|nr:hypothetical protein RHSIM_Rhsim12G0055600 [Rhododendron simsii]